MIFPVPRKSQQIRFQLPLSASNNRWGKPVTLTLIRGANWDGPTRDGLLTLMLLDVAPFFLGPTSSSSTSQG